MPPIYSYYSNSLTTRSPIFKRMGYSSYYYCDAIQFTVSRTGYYYFESVSQIDTYGYLYSDYFYSNSISLNQLTSNDDSGGYYQFLLSSSLKFNQIYILVVTTARSNNVGDFSITAWGPGTIIFSRPYPSRCASINGGNIFLTIAFSTLSLKAYFYF